MSGITRGFFVIRKLLLELLENLLCPVQWTKCFTGICESSSGIFQLFKEDNITNRNICAAEIKHLAEHLTVGKQWNQSPA